MNYFNQKMRRHNKKIQLLILLVRVFIAAIIMILSSIIIKNDVVYTAITIALAIYVTYRIVDCENHWGDKVK